MDEVQKLLQSALAFHKTGITPISDASGDKVYGVSQFGITNFNPTTAAAWVHNNLNPAHVRTGLAEGFHIVRARSFLPRDGKSSVFNTHLQTFYYDAGPPQGAVAFPAADGSIVASKEYGVVIRTDANTAEVEYNLQDADPNNDDAVTGQANGNGLTNGAPIYVKATLVTATTGLSQQYPALPREFRFPYLAVPATGQATINVRLKKVTTALFPDRYTVITRTITAAAPEQTLSVAYPAADGQSISLDPVSPYTIVARFSDSLPAESNRFTLLIDGAEQPRARSDGLPLLRFDDQTPGDGKNELRYDWSGMSAGQHLIQVHYAGPGLSLETMRLAIVNLVGVDTAIVSPPAVDAQNRPFTLVLPLKTNPAPAERSYTIVVETASAVSNVLISFPAATPAYAGGAAALDATFQGDRKRWTFAWTNLVEGQFTIRAEAFAAGADTASRTVQVVFRAPDSDGDGLPDDWERLYLFNELSAIGDDGANGDPDQDQFTNLEEYLAGTDPRDAASRLRVVNQGQNGRSITWSSAPGKTYQVLAATNAEAPFLPLATNVLSGGATTTYTDPSPSPARKFYRVSVNP